MSARYNIFGDDMSYKVDKFLHINSTDNPAEQTISTTYTEITGSKCEIKSINPSPTLMYKFSFYQSYDRDNSKHSFLNIKLQKSNDNFSSNIVDIPGQIFTVSGDTQESNDYYRKTITAFFIIENFDSKYLRLSARLYSSTYSSVLHRSNYYENTPDPTNIYYNPTLIVIEL